MWRSFDGLCGGARRRVVHTGTERGEDHCAATDDDERNGRADAARMHTSTCAHCYAGSSVWLISAATAGVVDQLRTLLFRGFGGTRRSGCAALHSSVSLLARRRQGRLFTRGHTRLGGGPVIEVVYGALLVVGL